MWLFRLETILDMASCAKDVQPSGRKSKLSERSVLIMEIACSRSATVRTLGQHRPNTRQSNNICPDDENFPSGLPSVSRSFDLFQVASVRTSQ
jgi:hypothetical protein